MALAQQTTRRSVANQETKSVWKSRVLTGALLIVFGTLAVFLWKLHPRQIRCRTSQHTICPVHVEERLGSLAQSPYRYLQRDFVQLRQEILSQEPSLVDITLRKRFDLTIEVVLTPAEPLFPLHYAGRTWMVHATGNLIPSEEPLLPTISAATESAWVSPQNVFLASENQRTALGLLWQSLPGLPVSFKRLELIEPTQVIATTTHSKQVVFTIISTTEVQRQLATLQSFLHSSTMEADWQEVDVRFTDIIVR